MTGGGDFPPCPKSAFFELMDFTVIVSERFNMTPFAVMQEDKDNVIMMINYFIEKGDEKQNTKTTTGPIHTQNGDRVRVNDKTASGGWF